MNLKAIVEGVVHTAFPKAIVRAPLPCWDSKNVGVTITIEKQMGATLCDQVVSFSLSTKEKDIATIQKRTLLAMNVLKFNVVSTFRPKKAEADAA